MASINFLYRSIRDNAPLTVRLLFRHNGNDYTFGAKTDYLVSADDWREYRKKRKQSNAIDFQNFKTETDAELSKIEKHILTRFFETEPEEINNQWMRNVISEYNNPQDEDEEKVPEGLLSFFDFYIDIKKNDLSERRIQRIRTTQNKLQRFEHYLKKTFNVKDVNDTFKNDFIDYCDLMQYSKETQKTDFSIIKTVCNTAPRYDIEISKHLKDLKVTGTKTKSIYLSFEEIEKIKELNLPKNGYLDNARDWLLISCYTGQRISDFMRFSSEMIEKQQGKYLLNFIQQKGKKRVLIPFLPEAKKVYDKRNGSFPKPISHQKYNDYIKEVCKLAGLITPTKGKRRESIAPKGKQAKRTDFRMRSGTFKKWELVSSHIGRRSFATNYYGKVPTSILIGITGHGTERMFLNYIHKADEQKAVDAFKYF